MLKFDISKIDKRNIDRMPQFWQVFEEEYIQQSLNETYDRCSAIINDPKLFPSLARGEYVLALTQIEELEKAIIREEE